MAVTTDHRCAWIETHPYDNTLKECVVRSAVQGGAARAEQPTEMTLSAVWADMDTTVPDYSSLLTNFLKTASVRMLKNPLRDKIYILEGGRKRTSK